DGNIVQNMSVVQSNIVDTWAQYQAKSTKQHIAESVLDQLSIERQITASLTADGIKLLDDKIAHYRSEVERYDKEKGELKKQAEQLQADYNNLNIHDDQFDMSEACISIGIALSGVTALVRKRWLLGIAVVFAGLGLTLGGCGFAGYAFHPDWLAKLLG